VKNSPRPRIGQQSSFRHWSVNIKKHGSSSGDYQ